jgi:RNA polymerase primary sigma factor
MAIDDRAVRRKQLIDAGKKRGYVLYDGIDELLPEDWENGRGIDDVLAELDRAGVEIREEAGIQSEELAYATTDEVDNPIGVYLREVDKVAPLTLEDEIELAKRIGHGGQDAEAAKIQLLEANLKIVVAIAMRYASRGTHVLDLIVEGNSGLLTAVETFDYTRGGKFSTCAKWCARHAIRRAALRK